MNAKAETSLLRVSFPSNATAQQPPQKGATTDATDTQQAQAKPTSLLDIARNKLRNNHATSSENGTQQAQKAQLEASALTGDLEAIRQWLAFIGEHDPRIISEVLDNCRTDADARRYFVGRTSEVPPPGRRSA